MNRIDCVRSTVASAAQSRPLNGLNEASAAFGTKLSTYIVTLQKATLEVTEVVEVIFKGHI